jgi:hypothetical protein
LLAVSRVAAGPEIASMANGEKPIASCSPNAYSEFADASGLRSASGMKSGLPLRAYRRVHSTKVGK